MLTRIYHALISRLSSRISQRENALISEDEFSRKDITNKVCSDAVADYWTCNNVTQHKEFSSRKESIEYFHWRCDQYIGYLELMPVAGFDGLDVLDYGCGPGNDLVGFAEYSRMKSLVGIDIAKSSVEEAKERLALHPGKTQVLYLDPIATNLPFDSLSFDYIHSSGVLHHVPDIVAVLKEFRRILRPNGRVRLMLYNYHCLWLHLYVAYLLRYREAAIDSSIPLREAFSRFTDAPGCPIANCYRPDEFKGIAAEAGFSAKTMGAACSLSEMRLLGQTLYEACMDPRLEREHRQFLLQLTYDEKGVPIYKGIPAGIDLVFELSGSENRHA
jgi:SAM-dependent methyltransferase